MTTTRTSRLLAAAALVVAVLAAGGTTATANTYGLPDPIIGLSETGTAAVGNTYTDHFWTIKQPTAMGRGCAVAEAGGSRGSHKLTVTAEQPGTVFCFVRTRHYATTVKVAFGRADAMPNTGKCNEGYEARIFGTPVGSFPYCWHGAAPQADAHTGSCPAGFTWSSPNAACNRPQFVLYPGSSCPTGYAKQSAGGGRFICRTSTTTTCPTMQPTNAACNRPQFVLYPGSSCPTGYAKQSAGGGRFICRTSTTTTCPTMQPTAGQ